MDVDFDQSEEIPIGRGRGGRGKGVAGRGGNVPDDASEGASSKRRARGGGRRGRGKGRGGRVGSSGGYKYCPPCRADIPRDMFPLGSCVCHQHKKIDQNLQ